MSAGSWCAAVVRPARSDVVGPFLCLFSYFLLLLFESLGAAEEHTCLLLPAGQWNYSCDSSLQLLAASLSAAAASGRTCYMQRGWKYSSAC